MRGGAGQGRIVSADNRLDTGHSVHRPEKRKRRQRAEMLHIALRSHDEILPAGSSVLHHTAG